LYPNFHTELSSCVLTLVCGADWLVLCRSVATRVAEQRKIEERLVHRSYNPYFAGTLPANAMGYHGGEMRLAHEKCTQDELSTFARARSVEGDGSHIGNCDMRAEEDALRHRNVLSPTKEGMREAFAYRY